MKRNGHPYREAEERPDISAHPGGIVVWMAYTETGKLLGPVRAKLPREAKERAAELYLYPFETIDVRMRR